MEAEGQAEIERVLEEFGREAWGDDGREFGEAVRRDEDDGGRVVARVDEGEPVTRRGVNVEIDAGEVVARDDVDDGVLVERKDVRIDDSDDEAKSDMQKHPLQIDTSEDDEPKAVRKPSPSPPAKAAKPKAISTKKKRTSEPETKSKPAKKKRKKGGDAIDDLFSGW